MKRILGALLGVAVGLGGLTAAAGPASADSGGDEMVFVQKLNELRAGKGLPALAIKGELFDLARSWSGRMAAAASIWHNPDLAARAPANWARLGENVGMGPDVQALHDAFVASPLHYRNMVDPEFDSVGVGVVHGAGGLTYVTVNFMRAHPAPAVAAAAPAGTAVASAPAPAPAAKTRICKKSRTGKVTCRTVQPRRVRARR